MKNNKYKKLNFNQIEKLDACEGTFEIKYRKPHKKHNANGLTVHPEHFKNKIGKIYLDPTLKEKDFLICVIDELIHSNVWALDNEYVGHMSDSMGSFLWNLGFRLKK